MLLAVANLDRETTEIYELFVKASDNGSPQREVRKRKQANVSVTFRQKDACKLGKNNKFAAERNQMKSGLSTRKHNI